MQIKRAEYPRPQFVRENWLNLNGEWQFEIDSCRKPKLDNECLKAIMSRKAAIED